MVYNNIVLFLHRFFVLISSTTGPGYLVGQFLLPLAESACGGGYSGPLQPAGAAVGAVGVGGVNQGEHGGLCLAGLLASTPGPRPCMSRGMRGTSCRRYSPCVSSSDKPLQPVLALC
jgi:hypothetical protein